MKSPWFKSRGGFQLPNSWPGAIITLAALAFCLQVFVAVDRRSHSVSDTIYGVFPYAVCSFLLHDWIARRTSHDPH